MILENPSEQDESVLSQLSPVTLPKEVWVAKMQALKEMIINSDEYTDSEEENH